MTATLIQPTHVLDLRTIPPRERHPLIFGRFDDRIHMAEKPAERAASH